MSAKTVVVTGASAGVGRAIALAFGRQKVALIARGQEGLDSAARSDGSLICEILSACSRRVSSASRA